MDFNEVLRALYIFRNKVKLPEWGGYWYMGEDFLIHEQDGELVSSNRFSMYIKRKDFITC